MTHRTFWNTSTPKRSNARPAEDVAGRKADIDAALKLSPGWSVALSAQAALRKHLSGTLNQVDEIRTRHPNFLTDV